MRELYPVQAVGNATPGSSGGLAHRLQAGASPPSHPSKLEDSTTSERQVDFILQQRREDHGLRSLFCAWDGHEKAVCLRCKGRTCGVCRSREFLRLKNRYTGALAGVLWPNFVTIAPENVQALTRSCVLALHRAVKKVLKRKKWKEAIAGGILFGECTNIGNGWHPHVHGLMDARWINAGTLAADITAVLGRSVFVKCLRKDVHWVLTYCLSYVKKTPKIFRIDGLPGNAPVMAHRYCSPAEVHARKSEYDAAYRGLRTVIPFGNLYNLPRVPVKKLVCPACGGAEWVVDFQRAVIDRLREEWRQKVPEHLRHLSPHWAERVLATGDGWGDAAI